MMQNKIIIGLTGGSGVGKGEVCRVFETLFGTHNIEIIDTDSLSHQVILSNSTLAYKEILSFFGEGILNDNNDNDNSDNIEINRKKLGAIVFVDKEKLNILSSIVHKYVIQRTLEIIEATKKQLIVIDAPVLVEAGMKNHCDIVLGIFAPQDKREERICARDNLTPDEAKRRINSQMPDEELAKHVDFRIDNTSSKEDLYEKVSDFINTISYTYGLRYNKVNNRPPSGTP
jgi:dephospho-CoA kinase